MCLSSGQDLRGDGTWSNMPSMHRSPRIQVTLSPEVMAALEEISSLTGQGKGTLVSELVTEALPALQAAVQALRVVKEAPREAQQLLTRFSTEATMKLAQSQLEFDDLLAAQPSTKRQKRRRSSNGAT